MYLFFDTETTGLPRNYQAPLDDFLNWPRIVQIAWSLYDADGHHWESQNYIIKPNGFVIPPEATKIHRISQERAVQEGVELRRALEHFSADVASAAYIVAHNIDFDEKIVGAELLREKMDNKLPTAEKICTMKTTAGIVKIPKMSGGYKWPNLTELYFHLFRTKFPEAHDAVFDVKACAQCFFELKSKGQI
ncbi:TPA: 3'-5' exonuclease [Candidatus Falkowbacteria bacterium]|nr:MAG: Exonuclease RNase T and DNA polymerase III [Candidatus Falkowbacteria bacterium GW2011_GWF2_43_32]HBA36586.1 3'-5' exonuclease [Candidatus Falkowbacteria bacterium]